MPIVFSSSSFGAAPESGLVIGIVSPPLKPPARACDRARRAVKGLGDSLVILEARKSRILSVRAGGILISVIKVAVCASL